MIFKSDLVDYQGESIHADEAWIRWFNSQSDKYGQRVFTYAADWAEGIEARIATGMRLEEVAKEEGRKAGSDGITGFMYGAAVAALSELWLHGKDLRRWHDKTA